MTAMTTICFALAVVMAAAGCVKADRVRAWRHGFNPSADELPSSAFVAGRAVFFVLAGIMAFQGFQLLAVSDDVSWSDSELTKAVQGPPPPWTRVPISRSTPSATTSSP
ncbi:hypothetical protein SAV31267_070130 [Streptomyces avermitilis]|uniref:Uncharacterized protein n=1 Tax=Streptomyces avermitilis TaxID=33903 RepID=A0A4D4MZA3_STRAX|nr:hypothetical protein SAV31267_070130 [Streptomyces avermitilis]